MLEEYLSSKMKTITMLSWTIQEFTLQRVQNYLKKQTFVLMAQGNQARKPLQRC